MRIFCENSSKTTTAGSIDVVLVILHLETMYFVLSEKIVLTSPGTCRVRVLQVRIFCQNTSKTTKAGYVDDALFIIPLETVYVVLLEKFRPNVTRHLVRLGRGWSLGWI